MNILIAPIVGFVGVLVGVWATTNREEKRRRLDWMERQLREFYSPLWAIRLEILSLSEHRARVVDAARTSVQELTSALEDIEPAKAGPEIIRVTEAYSGDIEYNNRQLNEILWPAYDQMQVFFKEHMHMADAKTEEFFPILVKFNETRHRFHKTNMPPNVTKETAVLEKELYPFYEHLKKRVDELRLIVKFGKVPKKN